LERNPPLAGRKGNAKGAIYLRPLRNPCGTPQVGLRSKNVGLNDFYKK
jgi:hypothetical protein